MDVAADGVTRMAIASAEASEEAGLTLLRPCSVPPPPHRRSGLPSGGARRVRLHVLAALGPLRVWNPPPPAPPPSAGAAGGRGHGVARGFRNGLWQMAQAQSSIASIK